MLAHAIVEDVLRVWHDPSSSGFMAKLMPGLRHQAMMAAVPVATATRAGRAAALTVLARRLARHTRLPRHSDVLFYAPTLNNVKALAPLLAWACEYGTMEGAAPEMLPVVTRISDHQASARLLGDLSTHDPVVVLQLMQGLASFDYFMRALADHPCRTVVVANDHNPVLIGLLHAARASGRKTVYRQHAPVAPNYPPLRTTLAILNDAASQDIYSAIAPIEAQVVTFPAFTQPSRPMRHSARLEHWLLPMSRVWDRRKVETCIAGICAHPEMRTLIIRPHPSDPTPLNGTVDPRIIVQQGHDPISHYATSADIAICGGTGAAVELLHLGMPVIYSSHLDELRPDPHGLVAAGILPDISELPLAALGTEGIENFFDSAWRVRFKRFDPTADESIARLTEIAYEAFTGVLLGGADLTRKLSRDGTDNAARIRAANALDAAGWVGINLHVRNG